MCARGSNSGGRGRYSLMFCSGLVIKGLSLFIAMANARPIVRT